MRVLHFGFVLVEKLTILLNAICLFVFPNYRKMLNKQLFFSSFPIINQFLKISGEGKTYIGQYCSFGYKLGGFHRGGSIELQARYPNSIIRIGNKVATNNNICIISVNCIEIGDDSLIGQNVMIMDHEAHGIKPGERNKIGEIGSVKIGNNVWIGNNVIILKNSEIGINSIVAAGAVVSGKFPGNVIIGGVPAKIIKKIE